MANVTASDYGRKPGFGGAYGNAFKEVFEAAGAPANGEKFFLGVIPAGVEVTDFDLYYDDFGTSVTVNVGYEPVTAALGPSAVANYWFAARDVATAAGRNVSVARPISFNHDVKLVATVSGTITGTPTIGAIVGGKWNGAK